MDEAQIYNDLNGIFCDVLDDDSIVLSPQTSASDIPEWDSFAHVNLVVASEMRFGVRFHSSELEELRNVGDFVQLIQRKLDRA